jgi:phosphoglycolate phosphatase-like HAD superfamily hydrolase
VLFDVDGTLLVTGGASSRAMKRTGAELFADRFQWGGITVGTLDPQIFDQLCRHSGITPADDDHHRWQRRYLEILGDELAQHRGDVRVLPGVRQALQALAQRPDMALGVLTGNWLAAVQLKLEAADLPADQFDVIVTGEDGDQRSDLPAVASRRLSQRYGQPIPMDRIVVVGDTPRDIACARANGCRCLAVATGWFSIDQLAGHGPDAAVEDLGDLAPLWRLTSPPGSP